MLLGPLGHNLVFASSSSSSPYSSFSSSSSPYLLFDSFATATQIQTHPAALINFRLLLLLLPFPLLLLALLVVLPGIREKRFLSLLAIGSQLCVGALLVGALALPFWKCSETEVLAHLQPFSKQRHLLRLGVAVGLRALNISLDYVRPFDGATPQPRSLSGMHLNEQFDLVSVSSMSAELRDAFSGGQPFPVLRVLEYFSLGQDAFAWGNQFRRAGYYVQALLWFSFGCWLGQCVLLPLLPHHFAKAGLLCGLLTLFANLLYILLAPNDLHIAFPSPSGGASYTQFRYGASFWMSIAAGFVALLSGSLLSLLQLFRLYSLSTFLDCSIDESVGPVKCRFGRRFGSGILLHQQQTQDQLSANCKYTPYMAQSVDESSKANSRSTHPFSSAEKLSTASSVSRLSVASSLGGSLCAADSNSIQRDKTIVNPLSAKTDRIQTHKEREEEEKDGVASNTVENEDFPPKEKGILEQMETSRKSSNTPTAR